MSARKRSSDPAQLALDDACAPVVPVVYPVLSEPSVRARTTVIMYRDRVISGQWTMEQYARALERHDHGYQGS
jgi:hypothetical protein